MTELDSDEEVYLDSGSEYIPDSDDSGTSDDESNKIIRDENETLDKIDDNSGSKMASRNSLEQNEGKVKDVSLNWSNQNFQPVAHTYI
ncbi:hypothetical protein QE152_g4748 [Popillia japonica]|uniref:Uncharacterized protein n=1 Tax=Popillia japonica TaxID=7064 RepID=A0AAW1MZV1_POPJA